MVLAHQKTEPFREDKKTSKCGISHQSPRPSSTGEEITNRNNTTIENHHFVVDLPPKKMVIFHSYISLPEGSDN